MLPVDVARGVSEETIHYVPVKNNIFVISVLHAYGNYKEPVVRIQSINDWEKGHGVLRRVDDDLEVRVAHLREEHVHSGPLLEPPPVLVLQKRRGFLSVQGNFFCSNVS